jgi:hypothetical protein
VLRPAFAPSTGCVAARGRCAASAAGLLGAAALAGAALVRPRLVMGLGARAWAGWQAYRRVQPVARALLRQLM